MNMVALCLRRRVNGQERSTELGLHKNVSVCVCVFVCVERVSGFLVLKL